MEPRTDLEHSDVGPGSLTNYAKCQRQPRALTRRFSGVPASRILGGLCAPTPAKLLGPGLCCCPLPTAGISSWYLVICQAGQPGSDGFLSTFSFFLFLHGLICDPERSQ